jgi:putative peptidoglycan lipid II flippase
LAFVILVSSFQFRHSFGLPHSDFVIPCMPLHYYNPPQTDPRPEPDPPSAQEETAASAKTTGLVALCILCSRVLGLIRDMLFAKWFDKGLRDCFLVAFRTPNMLRDLFAEGALSTAFVTVFSQKMKTEGDKSAWELAHRILSLATVFMSVIALGGVLLAPLIIRLLAGGWADEKWKIPFTVTLAQIMFPFILLVSLAALVMGILNAKKVYGVPAMASSFFNIMSIAGGAGLGWTMEKFFGHWDETHTFGQWAMIGFSIGTLLGGLAQLGVQLPALRKTGYRFKFSRDWKDSGVRRILHLMWPAVIAGSAVQVNVLINTIFASHLVEKDGPVSWLSYSFRLMQLPLGIFGVAVATVTLPALSRVATEGITPKFREILGGGNRLVTFLTLPSAVGLFLLAQPIISLLYERGEFKPYETLATAGALKWYAIGLVFYALIKVVQPAFTAIGHRFVPMIVALISIGVNAGLNAVFVFVMRWDHTWLAFTTAVVACANCTILYVILTRIAGGLEGRKLLETLARLAGPVVALGLVSWLSWHFVMEPRWAGFGFFNRALTLGLTITAAGSAYMMLAHLLKVGEAKQFMDLAARKLRK